MAAFNPNSTSIEQLVYPKEKSLFLIQAVISGIFWLLIVLGTVGIALAYLVLFYIFYLFAQSALIAWIKGNGVKIGPEQFPDLYQRYTHSCQTLGISVAPEAYILQGGGMLNAFATRFRGRNFIVLLSDIVDAMEPHPDAINFYIGHELAHIQRKHLQWGPFLWPAGILPLLGAAYSRAREYTCDQFGRACCEDQESAFKGLAALSAGQKRWIGLNPQAYLEQINETRGFWMSYHELVGDYPWLVKRAARISTTPITAPNRSKRAYILAFFTPRLAPGAGAASLIITVAIIGMLAAIALPAYQEYTARAVIQNGITEARLAADAVTQYIGQHQSLPADLASAGHPPKLSQGISAIWLNPENGVITVTLNQPLLKDQNVQLRPSLTEDKSIVWQCYSDSIKQQLLPPDCRH